MDQRSVGWVAAALFGAASAHAQTVTDPTANALARSLFQELIDINTTDSVGNVTTAADAMAKRLRSAGYPDSDIAVLGPNARKKNLVVRLHGSGQHKPVLLIGHLDVVEARQKDWTTDPFKFVEKGGYFYGRGTQDIKDGDAILVTTLMRFKKEGYVPDRDLILALTAAEEGGKDNGVEWLLTNHRKLLNAEFVLNHDGGEVQMDHDKPVAVIVDATEKLYSDYQVVVTNPGGHSSLPRPDSAIYELANALVRLQSHPFPFELNSVTRAYYEHMAQVEPSQRAADILAMLRTPPDMDAVQRLSRDPMDNARLHTTCVATRLQAGHANNALPARAEAVVNCRILPGHTKQEVRADLGEVFDDPQLQIRYIADDHDASDTVPEQHPFAPPPPNPEVFHAAQTVAAKIWPGTPLFP